MCSGVIWWRILIGWSEQGEKQANDCLDGQPVALAEGLGSVPALVGLWTLLQWVEKTTWGRNRNCYRHIFFLEGSFAVKGNREVEQWLKYKMGPSLYIKGNHVSGRETWVVQGTWLKRDEWDQEPKGGVFEAFERERDTSSIETREKTKKMGSEQHIFQNGNLSASI